MAGNNLSPIEALQIAAQFAEEHKLWIQPDPRGYYNHGQTSPEEKVKILTNLAGFLIHGETGETGSRLTVDTLEGRKIEVNPWEATPHE